MNDMPDPRDAAIQLLVNAKTTAGHKDAIAKLNTERDRLIRALHQHGLSLRDIADLADVSHVTVGEIVNGKQYPRPADQPPADLVTRTEIAARRDVNISTLMSWIDRYDFPAPVDTESPRPRWSWTAVEAYLDAKGLPRWRKPGTEDAGEARDARILAALREFPDGLTSYELADLLASDEEEGDPTPLAVRVRIDDRLRRLATAGKVARSTRPSLRGGLIAWKLTP